MVQVSLTSFDPDQRAECGRAGQFMMLRALQEKRGKEDLSRGVNTKTLLLITAKLLLKIFVRPRILLGTWPVP